MKFPQLNRKRSHPWRVAILLVLFCLILLLREPLRYWLTNIALYIAQPIWQINNFLFAEQNEVVESARVRLLEDENRMLKSALGYKFTGQVHLAQIISSLNSSPFDTFIIDQGTSAGLGFGQRVVSESGVLLGEVIEVYPKISKVQLYSANGKEIEVLLDDKERVMAQGNGGQNFYLRLPQGLEVNATSTLSLPGDREYIVAQVQYIKSEPGEAFQKVYARSPENIHSLERVYVIE